jgi:drug/metabolite transporter (DMT)-like permease
MNRATDPPSKARALLALHVAVALFGFAGLFGKWLTLPPIEIVFGRTLIASLALSVALRLQRRPDALAQGLDRRLAINGAVLALHWVAFFEAIRISSVAVALLGFASFPLFVLALEALTRQRSLRGGEWATAALVTVGLGLVVPEFRWENRVVQGLAWGSLSGLTFALLTVRNRALAERHAAGTIALWQNAWAAACLLPFVLAVSMPPNARDIALLVVLGVACTALSHTLFIASLRAVSAHVASLIAALEPVYGIGLAFLLLGETLEPRALAGAALLIGAALHATRSPRS